jgi:hypothetical protein
VKPTKIPKHGQTCVLEGMYYFYCTFCEEWIKAEGARTAENARMAAGRHMLVHFPVTT